MQKGPKMDCQFSVIVPVYNVREYLPYCIESIVHQKYKDFELILVDDGSTDDCLHICRQYEEQDHRIKVIHKENGGLVSARIAGAREANGDYTICIDGDDWIGEDYLATFAEIIHLHSPDLICAGYYRAYEDGTEKKEELPYEKGFYSKDRIKEQIYPSLIYSQTGEYFPPSICIKAFRTEMYRKHQCAVTEKIAIGEDFACTIPYIVECSSMFILSEAEQYYYRQNQSSMTKKRKAYNWYGPKMIWEHTITHININEGGFSEQLCRKTVHSLFNVVVSQFYRTETYHVIRKDILMHLKDETYQYAIKHARFHYTSKAKAVHLLLRCKAIWIIRIISYIRGR